MLTSPGLELIYIVVSIFILLARNVIRVFLVVLNSSFKANDLTTALVLLTAPDIIPKNLKGVGTWRNNMEISWEVKNTIYLAC